LDSNRKNARFAGHYAMAACFGQASCYVRTHAYSKEYPQQLEKV
jgi:hypothetical protein